MSVSKEYMGEYKVYLGAYNVYIRSIWEYMGVYKVYIRCMGIYNSIGLTGVRTRRLLLSRLVLSQMD